MSGTGKIQIVRAGGIGQDQAKDVELDHVMVCK